MIRHCCETNDSSDTVYTKQFFEDTADEKNAAEAPSDFIPKYMPTYKSALFPIQQILP